MTSYRWRVGWESLRIPAETAACIAQSAGRAPEGWERSHRTKPLRGAVGSLEASEAKLASPWAGRHCKLCFPAPRSVILYETYHRARPWTGAPFTYKAGQLVDEGRRPECPPPLPTLTSDPAQSLRDNASWSHKWHSCPLRAHTHTNTHTRLFSNLPASSSCAGRRRAIFAFRKLAEQPSSPSGHFPVL